MEGVDFWRVLIILEEGIINPFALEWRLSLSGSLRFILPYDLVNIFILSLHFRFGDLKFSKVRGRMNLIVKQEDYFCRGIERVYEITLSWSGKGLMDFTSKIN